MAKIDFINIRGYKERCVNLSQTVGAGGVNLKSDDLLIQALFTYLYSEEEAKLKGVLIPTPAIKMMVPTGILDVLTISAIATFQTIHRGHLLSVDAAIHPASYEGRVIKDTNKPLMTITYLHLLAKRKELRSGDGDYLKKLKQIIMLYLSTEFAASWLQKR